MGLGELERIAEKIERCTSCPLYKGRTKAVPGEGPDDAEIFLVGEAPGKEEDLSGRPFVGMAGKLLTSMLEEAGLRRENLFITSVIKCRPPGNRNPKKGEIKNCLPFLFEQIRIVSPRVVVLMGNVAVSSLRKIWNLPPGPLKDIMGRPIEVGGVNVIITYHPAGVLRARRTRRKTFVEHIKTAKELARLD